MLSLTQVNSYYDLSHILHDVDLEVFDGEIVSLLGRNGVGKTTTILTIMGYLIPDPGKITFQNINISGFKPYKIAKLGVGFVPQERRVFPSLTVTENLLIASRKTAGNGYWNIKTIYDLFPRLKERGKSMGFQLSGGEQQMLAIARALMLNPKLLLLDEPSEGLAPLIVKEIFEVIKTLKKEGLSVLLVEQNLNLAISVSDRCYVMSKGAIKFKGTAKELAGNEEVKKNYIGV